MRLIDADALRKEIRELPNENTDYFYLDLVDREVVQALISEAPTVERPSGIWIDTDVTYEDTGDVERRCSNCKHGDRQSPSAIVPYCWYCGADMRKEGDSDA